MRALRPHHTLPLQTVPDVVLDVERTLAAYNWLWLNQGINPGTGSDILKERYQEGRRCARQPGVRVAGEGMVSYGRISLVDNNDKEPSPPKPTTYVLGSPPRCWQQNRGRGVF